MEKTFANQELFEDTPVMKALYKMIVPTIFAQMVVLIYNLVDTFYIGRTNNPYMVAAASLILPVYNITISIAGLAGVGGGALVSRLLGVKQEEEAKKVSMFCIYISIAIAIVFAGFTGAFMDPVLQVLGADAETWEFAENYARCVIVLGSVPTVLSGTLTNLLRSIGAAKQAGTGISLGGCLNIILDPLFMFALFPSGMEVIGAGAATVVSNVVVCLYYILTVYRTKQCSVITFSPRIGMPGKKHIISILSVGIPSAISSLLCDLNCVIINKLAVGYGGYALAAIGIAMKAERLPLNVGAGISQGTMPIVAYNYSAGNKKRLRKIVRYSVMTGLITAGISIVLYEVFADGIMKIFIKEIYTISLGVRFLRIRCLATPFMFLSYFIMTMFQGIGEGKKALLLGTMRWGIFNIFMVIILNKLFGMYGIIWGQFVADTFTVLLSLCVLCFFLIKKKNAQSQIMIKNEQ